MHPTPNQGDSAAPQVPLYPVRDTASSGGATLPSARSPVAITPRDAADLGSTAAAVAGGAGGALSPPAQPQCPSSGEHHIHARRV